MSTDGYEHRSYHHADPDRVELRESDDGTFNVRMPIATTGEVRNEGDDPLTREELTGMAQQIETDGRGVFLDHGINREVGGSRYSAAGKLGEWSDPDIQRRETNADDGDAESTLFATAEMMDPETLPETAGDVREALAVLKAQAERGMSLAASIGWRDDDSFPGGVDLLEASIVGIPADPRTTTDADAGAAAVVRELAAVVGSERPERDMSDTDDGTTQSGDDPDTENDGSDGMDAGEFRETMLEQQREQTERLEDLTDAVQALVDDRESDGDEGDGDETGEQSADGNSEIGDGPDLSDVTVERDGEELTGEEMLEEYEETLAAVRDGTVDPDDVSFGGGRDLALNDETEPEADADGEQSADNDTADTSGWLK